MSKQLAGVVWCNKNNGAKDYFCTDLHHVSSEICFMEKRLSTYSFLLLPKPLTPKDLKED